MLKFLIALCTFVGSLLLLNTCAPILSKVPVVSVFNHPLSIGFLGALVLAGLAFRLKK